MPPPLSASPCLLPEPLSAQLCSLLPCQGTFCLRVLRPQRPGVSAEGPGFGVTASGTVSSQRSPPGAVARVRGEGQHFARRTVSPHQGV